MLVAASTVGSCKVCLCRAYEHELAERRIEPKEEFHSHELPKLSGE